VKCSSTAVRKMNDKLSVKSFYYNSFTATEQMQCKTKISPTLLAQTLVAIVASSQLCADSDDSTAITILLSHSFGVGSLAVVIVVVDVVIVVIVMTFISKR